LIVSACQEILSSEVEDIDKIYANYRVHYMKNPSGEYTTIAKAVFRERGTTNRVRLNEDNSITFNGRDMEYLENVPNPGQWWPGTLSFDELVYMDTVGYVSQAKFEYKDIDGNVYTNYAPLDSIGIASGTNLTLQYGDSVQVFWEGLPLGEDEEVQISFSSFFSLGTFKQEQLNSSSIWIKVPEKTIYTSGGDTLVSPRLGEHSFSILRHKDKITGINNPNDKGNMKVKYESGPYILNIIE